MYSDERKQYALFTVRVKRVSCMVYHLVMHITQGSIEIGYNNV